MSINQGDQELINKELETRIQVDKELITKLKRKYIKKLLLKTYNERFRMCNRNKKFDKDFNKARNSNIEVTLTSLLEKMSSSSNINRSQALISSF
jgi:translation initiation factor 2 beta subunit (eIF-2beta)/eIF-5